jgi:hypothetical protein
VLPLGTARLHALLLAWPALMWSAAWLLLASIYRVVNGPHMTAGYQLPALFVCIAVSALGIAIGLRLPNWWPQRTTAGFPLFIPFGHLTAVSPGWLTVIGVVSLTLAAVLNTISLSRGATYKRMDPLVLRTRGA